MPQVLFDDQEPFEPSGFLIDEVESVEVTLCHDPAVAGAKFRIIRSAGEENNQTQTIGMHFQRVAKANKYKQQVLGYVSTPWLEDWYGDVMDPESIERAAHSFLKNLSNHNVEGNGVGEEHKRFWSNAHVVESFVDRDGAVGGIPGGWWMNIQVTEPETWNKILNEGYTGFSLGSQVKFTYTRDPNFMTSLFDSIPNSLTKSKPVEPPTGKKGAFKNPGDFGYPTERTAYADPNNNKFPIDTRSRAIAVLRHIMNHWEEEGYTADELKYMTQRAMAAVSADDTIPEKVLKKIGFDSMHSITDFADAQGIRKKQPDFPKAQSVIPKTNAVSTNSTSKEEPNMELEALLAQFNEQSQKQNTLLQEIVNKLNHAPMPEGTPSTQSAPAAPAESTPATAAESAPATPAEPAPATPAEPAPAAPAESAPATPNSQSIEAIVQKAVADILKTQSTPIAEATQTPKAITAEDLQSALTQFGTAILTSMSASQQSTSNAIDGLASRISEMPMPRATMNRTMNKDQKNAFLAEIKRKIEDGSDISKDEYALAQSFGVDFNRDDPMAGVAF